ncbi:hypothetical protein [Scatolibacter rhodanostii]|uniref:hypothetical protein n=1 Tax=Scatolibacter rhodanostii TaxID=2014781 RepID=UPI000C083E42|nr:hypothetical protein [Scatolibacter rhodanostii]
MNELLKKTYEAVICYEKDTIEMSSRVDAEINTLLKTYAKQSTDKETEQIKSLLYQTALTAEQEGFQLGIKYTLKTLLDILSD